MKRESVLLTAVVVMLWAVSASAAPTKESLERLFTNLDANADGAVTQTEFLDFWKRQFKRVDVDRDHRISYDEFHDTGAFEGFDTNEDGYIDRYEDVEKRTGHFESMDKNDDGSLSLEELLSILK